METRKHIAVAKKQSGDYNCAQAVACAYCDLVGLEEVTAMNLTRAFGAGMGNMEGMCGALTGASIIVSLSSKSKPQAMTAMREVMTRFQQRNRATQCKLLKGVGSVGGPLRQCNDCVADAAEFLEDVLIKNHIV